MKSIDTLVEDIYGVFDDENRVVFSDEELDDFGRRLSCRIRDSFTPQQAELRISNLGTPDRKLWYTINKPELAEPIEAHAKIKFLFGHILEELLLWLAKKAGHTVTGEQDELSIDGVMGHRDAVIDNVLVDVKSASSYSFNKFDAGLTVFDDSFGYLDQLGGYHFSSPDVDQDISAFLVVDKQLGKLTLDKHPKSNVDYKKVVEAKRKMLASPEPPERCYEDISFGESGNMKLDVVCSYCPFKKTCWPGLRTFIYAKGPVYLTKVVRTPDVPEAT